jgi:hypothetical protein
MRHRSFLVMKVVLVQELVDGIDVDVGIEGGRGLFFVQSVDVLGRLTN